MYIYSLLRLIGSHWDFDPIMRIKGVCTINRSILTLFIWFCLLPIDPINRRLY